MFHFRLRQRGVEAARHDSESVATTTHTKRKRSSQILRDVTKLALCLAMPAICPFAHAQGNSWGTITGPNSGFSAGTMFLLTDGTVMIQNGGSNQFFKLTPDPYGNYLNGTWSQTANSHDARLYYASKVLRDGRVFFSGGEYINYAASWSNLSEIYDPVANSWTTVTPSLPAGQQIGDAICTLLNDGRVLVGLSAGNTPNIYDPVSNTWTASGPKLFSYSTDEESWTLLPDGGIITVDCVGGMNHAERFDPTTGKWTDAGMAPNLVDPATAEIGPSLLLPDGRVYFVGATGNTAFYTPSTNSWALGPGVPNGYKATDAPGVLEPNGKVIISVGKTDSSGFSLSTAFYEFDPTTNKYASMPLPPNNPTYTFEGRFLILPTGQILYASGTSNIAVWNPAPGLINPGWRPSIISISKNTNGSYQVHGLRLNGISEAVGYGDDVNSATNYPIVKFTSNSTGRVWYARSYNRSLTGVATGSTIETVDFDLPKNMTGAPYTVTVIANGIPSLPIPFTITTLIHN